MGPVPMSLQTKILVFASVCVFVPLLLTGAYLLRENEVILGEKVKETISNLLFRKTTQLDDWLNDRVREAHSWTLSFVVYEGADALTRPGGNEPRARRELQQYLRAILARHGAYESLFITDLRGNVEVSTRAERLEKWAVGLLPKNAPEKAAALGPIRWSETLRRPTLLVLQGISDRSDRGIGAFVGRVDLRQVESLLRGPPGNASTTFWLLDSQGRILARGGEIAERPGRETFPGFPADADVKPTVREAPLPGLGQTVYGLRRLAGPASGYLAATVPASAAYRSLAEARTRLLRMGGLAIAVILALNVLAARALVRSIRLLSDASRRMSEGNLDIHVPVRGADEISALTRSFNEMARDIRESRDRVALAHEELLDANRALETLAVTDGLTGLFNHRHFYETLDLEMRRADRDERPLSLVLMDVDHFKDYNDRYGHPGGDAGLRRAAGRISRSIRSTDVAFRYGGEEFAVLLTTCLKEQATEVAEKIRQAVEAANPQPDEAGGRLTISCGVATFPEDGREPRSLVAAADAALYTAKRQGRNQVAVAGDAAPRGTVSVPETRRPSGESRRAGSGP